MGESNIEWTDATWNPVVGCARVSHGCEHCYAEVMAARIEKMGQTPRYKGLTVVGKHGPRWSGEARTAPEVLAAPLRWKKPRKVFVNSMSDLFHEDVPFEYIAAVFGVMAAAPRHTFQVLTKRPARALEFFRWLDAWTASKEGFGHVVEHQRIFFALKHFADEALSSGIGCGLGRWPLPNVHLGVSVEDQRRADERIPLLLQCPAAVRWVSAEPLLGPVDLRWNGFGIATDRYQAEASMGGVLKPGPFLDWVVVGGESGRDPRPFDVAWARAIVAQCRAAGVSVFVKQLGANVVHNGIVRLGEQWGRPGMGDFPIPGGWRKHLINRKGGEPSEWPSDLRVRMFPGDSWPTGGTP